MRVKSFLISAVIIVGALALYWYFKGGGTVVPEGTDNPAYKAWAACKTGSTVTYKISSGKDVTTSTRTLIEVLPAMVIFSDHTTLAGKPYDATYVAFAHVEPKLLGLPSTEDVFFSIPESSTASPDTVQVKGAAVPATLHTISTWIFDPDNKSIYKIWTSEDFPGGVVKIEGKTLHWELVDFKKADADSARPAKDFQDSSPKGLLRMLDRQGLEKGREFIASLYDGSTPSAKTYADARSEFELAVLTLESAARARFGEATTVTEAIDRLADHHQSRADIEIGREVIENNKAALVYDVDHSVMMVKVGGHWRFAAFNGDDKITPEEITSELTGMQKFTTELEKFTDGLKSGKYKSESAFRAAVLKKQEKIAPENF